MTTKRFGLSCAISTPFAASGTIDMPRLIAHAKQCKSEGCDSITLFGTTGEGFSIGPKERPRSSLWAPRLRTRSLQPLICNRSSSLQRFKYSCA